MPITFLIAEDNYTHSATVARYVADVARDEGVPVSIVKAFRHDDIRARIDERIGDPELIISFDLQMERGEMLRLDDYIVRIFSPKSKESVSPWAINVPIIIFSAGTDDFGARLKDRPHTFLVPKIPRRGDTYVELKHAIRETIRIIVNR